MRHGSRKHDLGHFSWRTALAALLTTTAIAVCPLLAPTFAHAQSNVQVNLNIPAGSLSRALAVFGSQSGTQLSYEAAIVADKSSPGVRGAISRQQALSQLLQGSGLVYSFTDSRNVLITDPVSAAHAPVSDSSTVLDPIVITGSRNAASGSGFQGTPDWVYETPSSVSVISREALQNSPARDTRELFSGMAGVYVSNDNNQNTGTNVNIRGLQDQTRINTMIDGARQNFQRSAHGSTGQTYVDPSFIRQVDVEKSGTSGVGGAATLGGSVNYRTLVADDLIEPGRNWGAELDATTGTNAYDFSGYGSAAVRISDSFSILGGISHKKIGEYDAGTHDPNYDVSNSSIGDHLGSETWSGLLKTEMQPTDDTTFDLSWLRYKSEFMYASGGTDENDITNDTVTASFGWKPDNDLIDLKAKLWYNRTKDDETRADRGQTDLGETAVTYQMQGVGGSLENTSRFTLPFGDLALNYGIEAFRDDGDTVATSSDIDSNDWVAWWYQGSNGSGVRDVVSGFANAKLDHNDWLTIDAGIRYDYYRIDGATTIFGQPQTTSETVCTLYYANGTCRRYRTYYTTTQESYDQKVDLSGGAFSPTLGLTVKPADGLQLFTKYSHTYRPPTLTEAVLGGSHVGGYSMLFAPNPSIEPEEADTFEIGANLKYDDVFQAGDAFRMKAVAFYRKVDNYIAMGTIDLEGADQAGYTAYVNLDGETPMKGIELEANYDAGRYYLGGAFSYLDADYASTYTYNGASYTTSSYVIFAPPKTKFTVDAGVRFFEERLTVGGRASYYSAADKSLGGENSEALASSFHTGEYTLFDIYGSYKFNPKTTLRFAVNNVTDVRYIPAMGLSTYPGAGRTATISLNMKF